jgi:hypothetical protein
MDLVRVEQQVSPWSPDRVRLVAEVRFDDPARGAEHLWYDVSPDLATSVTASGNPWLAALLPFAVTLREPLRISLPVDPMLREGADALMGVWEGWYEGRYEPVPIEADLLPAAMPPARPRVASFFSGGIDSFHTVLRHLPDGDAALKVPIEELITVWGFDIPLASADVFERVTASVSSVAQVLGKRSVTVATNLRDSAWRATNWGAVGKGPALASIALLLEPRYTTVLIPSSMAYSAGRIWGTHPLTDPLLSTTRLAIRNDGATQRRRLKTRTVVESDVAMQHLRVCWYGGSERNCGRCEKCLRTLTTLELIGRRDRAFTFPPGAWSLEALAAQRLRNDLERRYQSKLAEHAEAGGRPDIARAIRRAVRRYDLRVGAVRLLKRLGLRQDRPGGSP